MISLPLFLFVSTVTGSNSGPNPPSSASSTLVLVPWCRVSSSFSFCLILASIVVSMIWGSSFSFLVDCFSDSAGLRIAYLFIRPKAYFLVSDCIRFSTSSFVNSVLNLN